MNFIRKKRKEEQFNLNEINNEEEKKTIIKLYLIDTNNTFYDHIEFLKSKQTFDLKDLIKNKTQEIYLNLADNSNIIENYYIEKIKIFKDTNFIEYNITIYMNKINQFAISLNNNKNNYTLEFYYYSKKNKLPDELYISKKETYKHYDNYNLLYRRRFNFINISKEIISCLDKQLNFNNYPSSISYKVCYRYPINFSIFLITPKKVFTKIKIDEEKKNDCIKKFKDFSKDIKILKQQKNFEEFKNNFNQINDKYSEYNLYFTEFSNVYNNLFINEFDSINENDISIIILLFYFSIYKYLNIKFFDNKIFNKFLKYFKIIEKIIDIFEKLLNKINENEGEINKNCDNLLRYKFCIIRSILFNVNEVLKKKNILSCLIDFDILIISNLNTNNCYIKSIDFLKKIIQNLNENSILFDILLQFDSEILLDLKLIQSDDIINVINDPSKFQNSKNSLAEINLLTVDQVKFHLFKLIPNIFLRYLDDGDNKFGYFDQKNKMTFINEYFLLEENSNLEEFNVELNNPDNYKFYSMPIAMHLIHENFTHAKIQLTNYDLVDTPTNTFDAINNFNSIIYEEEEEFGREIITTGEAGKNLEKYISQGNNYIINYLYSIFYNNSDIFDDIAYWTDSSFEKLRKNLLDKIDKEEKKNTTNKYYKYNNIEKKKKYIKYFKS